MDVDLNDNPIGGRFGRLFCSSPHPTRGDVWCRRQHNHNGRCRAFAFSISVPDEWDKPQ